MCWDSPLLISKQYDNLLKMYSSFHVQGRSKMAMHGTYPQLRTREQCNMDL